MLRELDVDKKKGESTFPAGASSKDKGSETEPTVKTTVDKKKGESKGKQGKATKKGESKTV